MRSLIISNEADKAPKNRVVSRGVTSVSQNPATTVTGERHARLNGFWRLKRMKRCEVSTFTTEPI